MGLRRSFRLKNEFIYTPSTWAEWADKGVFTINSGTIVYSNTAAAYYPKLITNLKPNTKYGGLFTVTQNTRNAAAVIIAGASDRPLGLPVSVNAGVTGNKKFIQTTNASFENNWIVGAISANNGAIAYGNFSLFELPPNSDIESHFTNKSADELAGIYPWFYDQLAKGIIGGIGGLR